jgi:hypothetical protein
LESSTPSSNAIRPFRDPSFPYGTWDAEKWADHFMEHFGDVLPNREIMMSWFANAIMTGFDAAMNEKPHIEIRTYPVQVPE